MTFFFLVLTKSQDENSTQQGPAASSEAVMYPHDDDLCCGPVAAGSDGLEDVGTARGPHECVCETCVRDMWMKHGVFNRQSSVWKPNMSTNSTTTVVMDFSYEEYILHIIQPDVMPGAKEQGSFMKVLLGVGIDKYLMQSARLVPALNVKVWLYADCTDNHKSSALGAITCVH